MFGGTILNKDLETFQKLHGNRDTQPNKVRELLRKVQHSGYIVPIVVNEKMEVIDGQHRIEVAKILGLDIDYSVKVGGNLALCKDLNSTANAWNLTNHIHSGAASGDENYIRLKDLIERYPTISIVTLFAATNNPINNFNKNVKEGNFTISKEDYDSSLSVLSWVNDNVVPYSKIIGGTKHILCSACIWILKHTEADPDRLAKAIKNNAYDITPPSRMLSTLRELSRLYNYRLGKNRIDFEKEYEEYARDNNIHSYRR